jgi:prepilin-type N-terminal cleavage/methylation domain-containing protein
MEMRSDQRGVTIIELLIALTILVVGILAVTKMMMGSIQGNRFANYETTAVNLAWQKLEEMKEIPWINLNPNANPTQPGTASDGPLQVGGLSFARSWTVTPHNPADPPATTADPDKPTKDTVRVDMTVAWTDPSGAHDITVQSIFSSYY